MSDQSWAALTAFLTIVGLRIVDWFLPKGRMSRWAARHSVPDDEDKDEDT